MSTSKKALTMWSFWGYAPTASKVEWMWLVVVVEVGENERDRRMKTRTTSFFFSMHMEGAFILLAFCLFTGCSSSSTSRANSLAKSADSQWSGVEVALGDESSNPSVMFANGSILSAKSISLGVSQDGGHVLCADGGAVLVPSNGVSRVTGEKMRITLEPGWDVRVLRGKLFDANGSVLQESHAEDIAKLVYKVRPHDTLTNIAERIYGDATAWRILYDANKELLQGGELREGMLVEIPSDKELDGPVQIEIVVKNAGETM